MDNKRLMIGMLLALAIMLGWNFFTMTMAKKYNWDLGQRPAAPVEAVQTQPTPQTASATPSGDQRADKSQYHVVVTSAGQSALLGSTTMSDKQWALGVQTQPQGAAISSVTLNQFRKDVNPEDGPYVFQHKPELGSASMATLWAKINGQRVDLSDAAWELLPGDPATGTLTYALTIADQKPVVRILKTLTVQKRDSKGMGYEVPIRHRIENLGETSVEVQLGIAGPTTPPRETERGPDLLVVGGYNKNPDYPTAGDITTKTWGIEQLKGEKQTTDLTLGDKNRPFIWAGQTSTYFDALILPQSENYVLSAPYLEKVEAKGLLPHEAAAPTGAELIFQTKPLSLEKDGAKEIEFLTFFGPKDRSVITNDYFGVYPRLYQVTLTTGGSCFCTIQKLVDVMVGLLRFFHWILRDWGLSIIALVILVRGFMHPLTRKSTESMHKMSKLAPEIERIKTKFKDNADEQQRAMMAFYKEHGAGQVLGCLPMFIQMPIWVALWSALQGTFELRLAPFLWGFTWIHDLAKPDNLIPLPTIDLYFFTIHGVNILPILMGVFFFVQQKYYTPKTASVTKEQEQQQKMMQWMMVLMFPLMLYNGPAGLNLYILTSTVVGMLESKWIKDRIKAREAAEAAAGPVIIDAPATRGSRRHRDTASPAKPKGRFGMWLERLQKVAEEAQKHAQQQQQRKKK